MLLSLAILCTVFSLFPLVIQNISLFKATAADNYDIHLEMCLRDVLAETADKKLSVMNGILYAKDKDDKVYSYMAANNRLIRKVDQQGYTILLEHVKKGVFAQYDGHIYLTMDWHGRRRIHHETFQIR